MKIALCLCPQWSLITPSFALGSLSAALEHDGHETEQIDLNLLSAYYLGNDRELFWRFSHKEGPIMDGRKLQQNLKDVVKIFEKFWDSWIDKMSKFDAVCFTTYETNILITDYIARKIKQINPKVQIWYGGPHCIDSEKGGLIATRDGKKYYREFVDVGCGLNEGEIIIRDLANSYELNQNYDGVKGVWIWDRIAPSFPTALPEGRSGRKPVYGGQSQIVNMNDLIPPKWDSNTMELYRNLNKETSLMIPIQTARGCTFKCTFCQETRLYRHKSAEKIRDDIKQLYEEHGVEQFWFVDSLMNGSIKQFSKVIDLIHELPYDIKWGGYCRTSKKMDDKMMKKAAESGLKWMEVGVESGVNKILGLMEKGQTTDDIEQVMKTTHNNDIGLSINWIPAFPQENSMDFLQNLHFLYKNSSYISNTTDVPMGFSEYNKNLRYLSRVSLMLPTQLYEGTPLEVHKSDYDIADNNFLEKWVSNDFRNNALNRTARTQLTKLLLEILDVEHSTHEPHQIQIETMEFHGEPSDVDFSSCWLNFANENIVIKDKKKSVIQSVVDDIKVWLWLLYKIKGDYDIKFKAKGLLVTGNDITNADFNYNVFVSVRDGKYNLMINQQLVSDEMNYTDTCVEGGDFNMVGESRGTNYLDTQDYEKYRRSYPRTPHTNRY